MVDLFSAVILGVVEGVTEYLPISSTGHLILAGHLLGLTEEKVKSFEVIIQVGAILSVVFLYWQRFAGLLQASASPWNGPGLMGISGVVKLGAVTLPALVAGVLLHKSIKALLFSPTTVAVAMIVGGLVMIWVERSRMSEEGSGTEEITVRTSFLLGCIQCLAMWPGLSRSGTVIVGGMLLGLNRKAAAEFSFLAAVPVLAAAAAKELLDVLPALTVADIGSLGVGLVVSFVTALLTVKWFIGVVGRMSLLPFAWYRIVAGVLVLLMLTR